MARGSIDLQSVTLPEETIALSATQTDPCRKRKYWRRELVRVSPLM